MLHRRVIADIDIIITNHEVNDYKRTKPMVTECNYVVLFPSATVGKADETDHRQDRSEQRDRETDNNIQDIKITANPQNIPYVLCDG